MSHYDTIFLAAAQLSVEDRLRLIDDLSTTVPTDRPPSLPVEWNDELDRRWEEIVRGKGPDNSPGRCPQGAV
jgi:putative addiction module component (TIGR02574 family)